MRDRKVPSRAILYTRELQAHRRGWGSDRTDWKRLISYGRKRDARANAVAGLPAASSTARSRDCDKKIGEGRVIPMCDVRCSVRLSSGQRLSPRKAFERRPFSLRTPGDVGRVRLKAVALVQEINAQWLFFS